jgi:hypothetical protein
MSFAIICIASIAVLGVIAALSSIGGKDEPIVEAHDCSSCSSMSDGSCKIACLMNEKKERESNNQAEQNV